VARVSLSAASDEVASHDPVLARLVATDGPMCPHADEEIRAMLASVPRGRRYTPRRQESSVRRTPQMAPRAIDAKAAEQCPSILGAKQKGNEPPASHAPVTDVALSRLPHSATPERIVGLAIPTGNDG
jgi:hypothetical protein